MTWTWFFDGLGTFLLGLVIGVGGDRIYLRNKRSDRNRVTQRQKAGHQSVQTQIGRDAAGPRE